MKIGFFRSNTDLLYQDEVRGDLFSQVEKTMELLLTKYLKAGIMYEGVQRRETYPVPVAALREAVLNAIVHKDYAAGTPVQVSVYSDKLMLWNPGELPASWTVAKLRRKHPSRPFNPEVANTFFRAGLVEAWGRGIERILEACRAAKVPSPSLRQDANGLWIRFSFPAMLVVAPRVVGAGAAQEATQDTTQETTRETTQERIVRILRVRPTITRREMATEIGLSADGIKYHLTRLSAAKRIRHVGPTKAGHWEVL